MPLSVNYRYTLREKPRANEIEVVIKYIIEYDFLN